MAKVYVPPCGSPTAKIMLVGEAPGENEVKYRRPFCGAAGEMLDSMLAEAGIARDACWVTNVARYRPPDNKISNFFMTKTQAKKAGLYKDYYGKYPHAPVLEGLLELAKEVDTLKPNLIIAFGSTALWGLTGITGTGNSPEPTGIQTWRSSVLETSSLFPPTKVIPCVHPAALFHNYSMRHVTVQDLRRCRKEAEFSGVKYPAYDFLIRPSFSSTISFLTDILLNLDMGKYKIAIDIETRLKHIACLGIATSTRKAICIPFMSIEHPEGYWSLEEETSIVWELYRILTHPNCIIVGQNFDYDIQYMARSWGFAPIPTRDTLVYHHTCFPGVPQNLGYLSSVFCDFHQYWKGEGKEWDPKIHDEERLWTYNCKDCVVTYEVDETLPMFVMHYGLESQVQEQMDQIRPLLRMELRGVNLDLKRRAQLTLDMIEYMTELQSFFEYVIPDTIWSRKAHCKKTAWYDSPVQTAQIFYDVLQQPEQFAQRGKGKKSRSTDDDCLEAIGDLEPLLKPITTRLQDYRSCATLIHNFLSAKLDWDQRMRFSMNFIPETFRYSSSSDCFGFGGNIQNITKGEE